MKIGRCLLRDNEDVMPNWAHNILTPAQANVDATSAIFRWRLLLMASDLSATAKWVGVALSLHCNSTKLICHPSISRLASETSFSRKTVEAAIKILEGRGYLYVWRQHKKVNMYGPSWPETFSMGKADDRCGVENREGKPCERLAGWGVKDKDSGPCRYHVEDRTTDRSTDRTTDRGQEMPPLGQEMPSSRGHEMPPTTARDAHEGTKEGSTFFEGSTECRRSQDERRVEDYFNDEDLLTDPFSDFLFDGNEEDELREEGEDAAWGALEYDELLGVPA